jgi:hypothetical protein
VRVDVDGYGEVAEGGANEGQPGHVLADGGLALAFEDGVEQRELPEGRRVVGEDAVAPAVEAEVLTQVADLGQGGEARTDVKIHVAQDPVLGHMEANGNGSRVSGADLEVDVAHRRIESNRAGIGEVVARRHAPGRGKGHARAAGRRRRSGARSVREHHHQADALLIARRIVRQHEHRPRRAEADHPHAAPDVERAGQPIATGRQEHDATVAGRGRLVQGGLERSAVVRRAVADYTERFGRDEDGARDRRAGW